MINEKVKELAQEWLEKAMRKNASGLEKEMDKFIDLYIAYNVLYNESSTLLSQGNEQGLQSLKDKISNDIEKLKNEMYRKVKMLDVDNCEEVKEKISNNLMKIKELKSTKKKIIDKLTKQIKTHDKVSATENIPKFLGQEKLYNILIEEKNNIDVILNVIKEKKFYFSTEKDNETADYQKDKELFEKIQNHFKENEEIKQQEFNESLLSLIYATRCNMFHGQKNPKYQTIDVFYAMNSILERILRSLLNN